MFLFSSIFSGVLINRSTKIKQRRSQQKQQPITFELVTICYWQRLLSHQFKNNQKKKLEIIGANSGYILVLTKIKQASNKEYRKERHNDITQWSSKKRQ